MEDKAFYCICVLFLIGLLLVAVGIAWYMSIDFGMYSPQFFIALGIVFIGFCFAATLVLAGLRNY